MTCSPECQNAQAVYERVQAFLSSLNERRQREEAFLEDGEAMLVTITRMREAILHQQQEHSTLANVAAQNRCVASHTTLSPVMAVRSSQSAVPNASQYDGLACERGVLLGRQATVRSWLASLAAGFDEDDNDQGTFTRGTSVASGPLATDTLTIQRAAIATVVASGFSTAASHQGRHVVRCLSEQCARVASVTHCLTQHIIRPLCQRHQAWERDTLAALLVPVLTTRLLLCLRRLIDNTPHAAPSLLKLTEAAVARLANSLGGTSNNTDETQNRELAVLQSRVTQQRARVLGLLRALTSAPPDTDTATTDPAGCVQLHILSHATRAQRLQIRAQWKQVLSCPDGTLAVGD